MKKLLIFAASLCATAAAANPAGANLDEVRKATERFQDVKVALAEGYIRDPMDMCVVAEDMGGSAGRGAMGIHYVHMGLLGVSAPPNPRVSGSGTHTDFTKPAILLYEPQADGSLKLVGVENLVFKSAWEKAGNKAPRASRAFLTTIWRTIRRRSSMKPTTSSRITTATSGSIATIRTACTRSSTRT